MKSGSLSATLASALRTNEQFQELVQNEMLARGCSGSRYWSGHTVPVEKSSRERSFRCGAVHRFCWCDLHRIAVDSL